MANRFAIATGNWSSTSTWSTTAGGSGGASVPVAGDNAYANSRTVTIDVNAAATKISTEAENGATGTGVFTLASGVTLTADVKAGGSTCLQFTSAAPAVSYVIGNITGGTSSNARGLDIVAVSGSVSVTGNITGGSFSGASGIFIQNGSSGTYSITGSVTAGTGGSGILVSGSCNLNVTGAVQGPPSGSNLGITVGASGAQVTVVGSVTGGGGSNSYGIYSSSTSTFSVTGSVTGGTSATSSGFYLDGAGSATITGSCTGSNVSTGATNNAGGTLRVTRAVGNGYGVGTIGISSAVGVASTNQAALTYVEEIEYGALGQSPTSGHIRLTDVTTNRALFYRFGTTKKTLYDPANIAGVLPAVTDVRYGTSYNSGGLVGTCYVPAAGSVAFGVNVDATTGTALLTAAGVSAAVWDALTSGMATSGSIGERLKNCSTVASTGQQLSDALTG
jgi:hypothetical protein